MTRQWAAAIVALFLYVIVAGTSARGEIVYYKWVDKDGVTHYTNVKADAPDHATIDKVEPAPQIETSAPPVEQKPPRSQAPKRAQQPAQEEIPEPVPPAPQAPPAQSPQRLLRSEIDTARQAELEFQSKAFKWLTPEEITQYISEDDLQQIPRYGYDRGQPRIRRVEAIFYMRNKIKRLEGATGG